jgi:hypothetical protein
MNERIKELAEQLDPVATIGNWGRVEWADNVYPQLGDKMYADIDLQKFAELIVRGCVDIAYTNADVDETYDYACYAIAWKIKKHFGVGDE